MKRRTFIAAALTLLSTTLFADDAKVPEAKGLAGTWTVKEAEAGGQLLDSPELKGAILKITGDRYEVTIQAKTETGSLKLDEASKPNAMDISPADGPNSGRVFKAVYELDGDTLRVCYMLGEGARPADFFTTTPGTLRVTYTRKKE